MSGGARILVVDDEPQIRRSLEVALELNGFDVSTAQTGEQALEQLSGRKPDLLVVDLVMPGSVSGIEVTQRARAESPLPIIVLSALGEETKKVEALEAGADDYLTKPFGVRELVARIRALLRRTGGSRSAQPVFQCDGLSIDFSKREVRLNNELVKLTPTEYDLLKFLTQNVDKVITHRMLLEAVWGPQHAQDAQYLRVFVGQLRKKIEKTSARPRYILTDPGVGYRFSMDPPAV